MTEPNSELELCYEPKSKLEYESELNLNLNIQFPSSFYWFIMWKTCFHIIKNLFKKEKKIYYDSNDSLNPEGMK